jgi:hypothetical protein
MFEQQTKSVGVDIGRGKIRLIEILPRPRIVIVISQNRDRLRNYQSRVQEKPNSENKPNSAAHGEVIQLL